MEITRIGTAAKHLSEKRISRRKALTNGTAGLALGALATGLIRTNGSLAAVEAQEITEQSVTDALPQLETLAADTLTKTGVPGMAIAVVYQDKVVYLKGFGVREVGKPATVDADTVFQLASLSKCVASTVVAGVVADKVASWDSRISDLDPAFQLFDPLASKEVTIRDMFAHRSGLPGHAGDDLEDIGYDREAVLHRLRYQVPGSSFRSTYAYTNFGLTAGAVAAAKTAGKTWEDLCSEKLYDPLGMKSTSSRYDDFLAAANRAAGHVLVDGQYVAKYHRDADAQSPAGGVSSCVRDLATWLRLQLGNGTVDGKEIIGAEALAETHRPQVISKIPANPAVDLASFYGLGMGVGYTAQGKVRLSHSGAFALGAGTNVWMQPGDDIGIVVLTNAAPIGVAEAMSLSFFDLVETGSIQRDYVTLLAPVLAEEVAPLYGSPEKYTNPPAGATPALSLDAYTGTFENDYFGEIEFVANGEDLALHLGPKKTEFSMVHYDRDVFLYQPTGENAGGPSGVTFEVGADGIATSVLIENLNVNGMGAFARAEVVP